MDKIPLIDLHAQYESIKSDVDEAIAQVIEGGFFIGGSAVSQFERSFAMACGIRHCVGLANGTDALMIALHALNVGAGDEVITVAMSWISTADTISRCGATPVFVDIEPDGYNIDVTLIEKKINSRTRAIIVVHLYGHPADMDPVVALCKKHGLKLIEDCAQAHLAKYKGVGVGQFGDIATFSFYPTKNLGAYGDAGAIVTNDDALATQCRLIASQGASVRHHHVQ
ncbi:MAG: DegT/DnrJ/EryC1/StrS family aminotransferase, partial [Bacteroidota bacterium]